MSKSFWVQHGVEHELLELNDYRSDAAASFPPSVRIKTRVARVSNRDTCRMTFHDSIKHSSQSSRVVLSSHEHDGSELILVTPRRKHQTFTFGPNVGYGNLHDIRHAKPLQLA